MILVALREAANALHATKKAASAKATACAGSWKSGIPRVMEAAVATTAAGPDASKSKAAESAAAKMSLFDVAAFDGGSVCGNVATPTPLGMRDEKSRAPSDAEKYLRCRSKCSLSGSCALRRAMPNR